MQTKLRLGLGFSFKPTEEELVKCFLQKKVRGEALSPNPIIECDLYGKETPWEIFNDNYHNIWYCFTTLKKTSRRRISRVAAGGTWHGGTSAKEIVDSNNKKNVIGFKKTFSFKINGKKSDWIMHEFTLAAGGESSNYAVCKLKNKKAKALVHHNHTSLDEQHCVICYRMRLIRMNKQTENMGNKAISHSKQLSEGVLLANKATEAPSTLHGVETQKGNLPSLLIKSEVHQMENSASEKEKWIRSLEHFLMSDDPDTTETDDGSFMIEEYLQSEQQQQPIQSTRKIIS